uniref:Uncharacterized protein n=1 Tax=Glossina palpalis gambiensis TaxID=67801 RepID=A0A1B0C2Z9_9MUSC
MIGTLFEFSAEIKTATDYSCATSVVFNFYRINYRPFITFQIETINTHDSKAIKTGERSNVNNTCNGLFPPDIYSTATTQFFTYMFPMRCSNFIESLVLSRSFLIEGKDLVMFSFTFEGSVGWFAKELVEFDSPILYN